MNKVQIRLLKQSSKTSDFFVFGRIAVQCESMSVHADWKF